MGQCYGIAVFRPLKFETLCNVSGISKARGSGTGAGPRATVATRVPAVRYYRGFSLLLETLGSRLENPQKDSPDTIMGATMKEGGGGIGSWLQMNRLKKFKIAGNFPAVVEEFIEYITLI